MLTVILKVINGVLEGNGLTFDAEDFAVVSVGLGLLTAKDKNVTGGTVRQ